MDGITQDEQTTAMTPAEYLAVKRTETAAICAARRRIEVARQSATKSPFPANVRPATPEDIVVGAILWYRRDRARWAIVEEVIEPNNPWKGYVDEDGARAGYDGAFVDLAPSYGCRCGIPNCEGHTACTHPPGSATCAICTLAPGDTTSPQAIAARALRPHGMWR